MSVFKWIVGILFERRSSAKRTIRRIEIYEVGMISAEILSYMLIIAWLTNHQFNRIKQMMVCHDQLFIAYNRLLIAPIWNIEYSCCVYSVQSIEAGMI